MVQPCPLCHSPRIAALETPVEVPILLDRVYPSFEEARAAPSAPVHLFGCADCGYVFERFFGRFLGPVAGCWRERVRASAKKGPVAVWGAGARGVTFALMVDAENRLLDHVVDSDPAKQNRHIAGTGLRVLAPRDAACLAPRTIFVMNPNDLEEIAGMARAVGMDAALVPID